MGKRLFPQAVGGRVGETVRCLGLLLAVALQAARRVSARRGWVGEKCSF